MHRYLIRSAMPSAIMTTERKSAWIPFSAVKMRWQTISPDMCGWHLLGGMLYGIREPGRGYIAYKLPGQKLGFGASMELVKALFSIL